MSERRCWSDSSSGDLTWILDEFFMKRISVLRERREPEHVKLLETINCRLLESLHQQATCFRAQLVPQLAGKEFIAPMGRTDAGATRRGGCLFRQSDIGCVDTADLRPGASVSVSLNLSTSLAFALYDPGKGTSSYARVKVPNVLRQWIALTADAPAGQKVLTTLHEVIRGNVHKLYTGMRLTGTTLFRLARDAEVEIGEDSDEMLRDVVREQIRQRRYGPVVRLEFQRGADPSIREMLRRRFNLAPVDTKWKARSTIPLCSKLPRYRYRRCAIKRGRRLRPRQLRTARTSSKQFVTAMCWFIIPMKASNRAWSSSSRTRRRIRKRSP
jgi:polyphosphate kinase